ncbi:hypothetical protein CPAR01_06014 [Colletotrichum paranaense]|uniref:Uncharacterized protein n=1 Tax=Colletotrichum paranaense TaxID=1914294 RepID=A0ABQ9SSY7_9PEZI|nr:uncharacterized protein CPAR01_06014 [Colletotrichum paranaense]KAK1542627.1 hypothetical protein CPAR01_06014 [Colletotrichum paranaense]
MYTIAPPSNRDVVGDTSTKVGFGNLKRSYLIRVRNRPHLIHGGKSNDELPAHPRSTRSGAPSPPSVAALRLETEPVQARDPDRLSIPPPSPITGIACPTDRPNYLRNLVHQTPTSRALRSPFSFAIHTHPLRNEVGHPSDFLPNSTL